VECDRGSIFPFLIFFDLIADVLNILLNNAKSNKYLKGLGQVGEFQELVNFHFVDDILLFLEANSNYIEVLK
jgi:hypothetical protein